MKGNFSDDLIDGLVMGFYGILNDELNYYRFVGIWKNRAKEIDIDEIEKEHSFLKFPVGGVPGYKIPYTLEILYKGKKESIIFYTIEWLQGFISACNAMHVNYQDYFTSVVNQQVKTATKYSILT